MKLASKLHISEAEQLSASLLNLLSTDQKICIDISEVNDADTASIQVLCALQKSLSATNNAISWQGKSSVLSNIAQQLGVKEFLNLPD
ncbi:STAS domain-containing protein [Psychrosphaera aestuarii]|uniref:STAS domain-containing protein n=1 Tax=Psychrosphaera aestuarii TaxID=1266052 RepID=UPI001B3336FD|nr:STAS domain-containing protein [Psychrosphaera aestuarii]